jgi:hypothetical protein
MPLVITIIVLPMAISASQRAVEHLLRLPVRLRLSARPASSKQR